MKKIGLLTCFIDNYGACLQAFALQSVIKNANFDCEIIKYVQPAGYCISSNVFVRMLKNKFSYFIVSLFSKKHRIVFKKMKEFNKFRNKYLTFSKKTYYDYHNIEKDIYKYNCYVCGSDQVWNPMLFGGNDPVYTMKIVPDDIGKIAYAPSIALKEFPAQYKAEFINLISRFSFVSVREEQGVEIINKELPNKAMWVLDPTLLLEKEQWMQLCKSKFAFNNYIFVYLFGKEKKSYEFIDLCSKKLKKEVVFLCVDETNLNNNYTHVMSASPNDFIYLIAHADLVITDSFHATAFSINLNVPFYDLYRNKNGESNNMNSRIDSILSLTNLNNRLITDFDSRFIPDLNINFEDVNLLLNKKRSKDIFFLCEALKNG